MGFDATNWLRATKKRLNSEPGASSHDTLPSFNVATRYALSLATFLLATAIRLTIDAILPGRSVFVTYFPALLVATYFFGLGPGLLCLALSSLAPWWLWPDDSVLLRTIASLIFLGLGTVCVLIIDQLSSAHVAIKEHRAQLLLINNELLHRIKNLFAITSSICTSTIKSGLPADEAAEAVAGRIQSIALAQERLSVTARSGAGLADLVDAVVAPLAPSPDRLEVRGPHIRLKIEDTTPFALVRKRSSVPTYRFRTAAVMLRHHEQRST